MTEQINPTTETLVAEENNTATATDELTQLATELEQAKKQTAALADELLRTQAETQNIRRRSEEEISKAKKFAVENLAESLLPVIDSLEAALSNETAATEQIIEGTTLTLNQLKHALERNKIIAIAPEVGELFDPHHHQAISTVPSEQATNTVVTLLQKGYLIADRILRPALVIVAAEKNTTTTS